MLLLLTTILISAQEAHLDLMVDEQRRAADRLADARRAPAVTHCRKRGLKRPD